MAKGTFRLPILENIPTATPWAPPVDWIDISNPNDNEINMLVSDSCSGIAFVVTVAAYGTYTIDWGDGTIETLRASNTVYQHQYTIGAGTACSLGYTTFKIRIYGATGDITSFIPSVHTYSQAQTQYSPILNLEFGTANITTYDGLFFDWTINANLLKHVGFKSFAGTNSISYPFYYCATLESVTLPSSWGAVTNVTAMFQNCTMLQSVVLPTSWGSITNIDNMFNYCQTLQSIILPQAWNSFISVSGLFYGCSNLKTISIPNDWGFITNTSAMFTGCGSLELINLPASWGNVTDVSNMFYGCSTLSTLKLPASWGNVTTCYSMFYYCGSLTTIKLPSTWDNIVDCSYMFQRCSSLRTVNLPTSFENVTTVAGMFTDCTVLRNISFSDWGAVGEAAYMFSRCYNLSSVILPSSWGNISSVYGMFYNCSVLQHVTLPTSWANVEYLNSFFEGCISISKIILPIGPCIAYDTEMQNTFYYCYSLRDLENIEYFGSQSRDAYMIGTFSYCEQIPSITIGARLLKFDMDADISVPNKVTSIRFTNASSSFQGDPPQVNISYCSLGDTALNLLFTDLPSVVDGQSIQITGNPGAGTCNTTIATGKGWTVIN